MMCNREFFYIYQFFCDRKNKMYWKACTKYILTLFEYKILDVFLILHYEFRKTKVSEKSFNTGKLSFKIMEL